MNPLMPIYIALAFVNPQTGHIIASAHGVAADMPHCAAIANEAATKELATNPELKGAVPIVNCWDVRVQLSRIPHAKPAVPTPTPKECPTCSNL